MTSTMKSEPSGRVARTSSFGVPVSAAATTAEGGNADGSAAGAALGDVAETAALATLCDGATALAAPATATPVRNLRRSTAGRGSFDADAFRTECFRSMAFLPSIPWCRFLVVPGCSHDAAAPNSMIARILSRGLRLSQGRAPASAAIFRNGNPCMLASGCVTIVLAPARLEDAHYVTHAGYPCCIAARGGRRERTAGRAILRAQDHHHRDRLYRRRQLRSLWPHGGASSRQAHPRPADRDRAEHAGRRQPQGRQLHLRGRAEGWHRARSGGGIGRARAGACQSCSPIRCREIHLCRPRRHQQQHLHAVAHAPRCSRSKMRDGWKARPPEPGRDRSRTPCRGFSMRSPEPGSSSSAAIPPPTRRCSRWSAARSTAPRHRGRR